MLLLTTRGVKKSQPQSFCHNQDSHFSAANFAKFCGTICEILLHYYAQIPEISVGTVVLTDYLVVFGVVNLVKCPD